MLARSWSQLKLRLRISKRFNVGFARQLTAFRPSFALFARRFFRFCFGMLDNQTSEGRG